MITPATTPATDTSGSQPLGAGSSTQIELHERKAEADAEAKTPDNETLDGNKLDKQLASQSNGSFFSDFNAFPKEVRFEGEEAEEKIILLMRAHLVTNIKWLATSLLALIVPLIIFPLLGSFGLSGIFRGGTIFVSFIFWYLATFTYTFINFLSWYFNVYIITNERVVDLDWYSLLFHKISFTRISKIQDVSIVRSGVFASLFDYGDIHIQTAGTEANFEFISVPHPQLVKNKLEELMEEEEKEWEVNK